MKKSDRLIHFAHELLSEGKTNWVRSRLYDGKAPSNTVIKVDLDFVAHHWQDKSVDLWEEVVGDHFFTRMVQRRALIEGAKLAQRLGDEKSSHLYSAQAQAMTRALKQYWNPKAAYVQTTLNSNGAKDKYSNLDVAVILASLRGYLGDHFFSPGSDPILGTAESLRKAFVDGLMDTSPGGETHQNPAYKVNSKTHDSEGGLLAPAIGRYPEDVYNGLITGKPESNLGNPWVLATEAYAELCYRTVSEWVKAGQVTISSENLSFLEGTGMGIDHGLKVGEVLSSNDPRFQEVLNALIQEGDAYLRRVRFHAGSHPELAEEINRDTGDMQGAQNLTWNYAAFLSALRARGIATTSVAKRGLESIHHPVSKKHRKVPAAKKP